MFGTFWKGGTAPKKSAALTAYLLSGGGNPPSTQGEQSQPRQSPGRQLQDAKGLTWKGMGVQWVTMLQVIVRALGLTSCLAATIQRATGL